MLEDPISTGSLEGQGKLVLEVSAESRSRISSCLWYKVALLGHSCGGDAAACHTWQTDRSSEVSVCLLLHSELLLPNDKTLPYLDVVKHSCKVVCRFTSIAEFAAERK